MKEITQEQVEVMARQLWAFCHPFLVNALAVFERVNGRKPTAGLCIVVVADGKSTTLAYPDDLARIVADAVAGDEE